MTRVKICGITNLRDALIAAEAGADLLGFVFYPQSPRYISPEKARQINQAVHRLSFPVRFVGVFVDEELDVMRRIVSFCELDYAQLHGSESPKLVTRLIQDGLSVIKAFRVRNGNFLTTITRYRPTVFLLDTYVPAQPGGTGQTFDWRLATRAKEYGPVILAGGLTPENAAEAIHTVGPWGVDVSTGIESVPGQKDHDKLQRFIAVVKGS